MSVVPTSFVYTPKANLQNLETEFFAGLVKLSEGAIHEVTGWSAI